MLEFDNDTDMTSLDVAAVYGQDYTEPEECPALTPEEAAKVLEDTMAEE